jgi:hypothetical protein
VGPAIQRLRGDFFGPRQICRVQLSSHEWSNAIHMPEKTHACYGVMEAV